jgi:hypothetical protein
VQLTGKHEVARKIYEHPPRRAIKRFNAAAEEASRPSMAPSPVRLP